MTDSKSDFQQVLQEAISKKIYAKTYQEKLLQDIVKKHEKNNMSTFQQMLQKNVMPLFADKVAREANPTVKENSDNKGKIDVGKQVNSGANPDNIIKDVDEKKQDIGENNNSAALSRKEEMLKQMYVAALNEYYRIRSQLYKAQIENNDITLYDKDHLELLRYENYLRKCDVAFKQINGKFISSQDKEIAEKENKYVRDANMDEKELITGHDNSIDEINKLNERIEHISGEITKVLDQQKQDGKSHEDELSILEKEYVSLNARLHVLKPDILELYRQEEEREFQDKEAVNFVGTAYREKKADQIVDSKASSAKSQTQSIQDSAVTAEELVEEKKENDAALAGAYIVAGANSLENNNFENTTNMYNKADELITSTKTTNSSVQAIKKGSVDSKSSSMSKSLAGSKTQTQRIDEHVTEVSNNPSSSFERECANAVYTIDQRTANDIKRLQNPGKVIQKTEMVR